MAGSDQHLSDFEVKHGDVVDAGQRAQMDEMKKGNAEMKEYIAVIESRFLSRNPFKIMKPVNIVAFVIFILAGFVLYKRGIITFVAALLQALLGLGISVAVFNRIQQKVQGKSSSFKVFSVFVVIIIFFTPVLTGYLAGWAKIKEDSFLRMDVTTQDEIIEDVALINLGKGIYIFRSGGKNIYIPVGEVKKLKVADRLSVSSIKGHSFVISGGRF
jgi:hypothetical protein